MINRDKILDDEHEKILGMMKGAYIFGKPVDIDSVRDLVVCAFYTGRSSRDEQIDQLFQELENLYGGRK